MVAAKAVRVIGPGRAGLSLARGLEKAGWRVDGVLGRGDEVSAAAAGVDLLVIATPDSVVAAAAAAVAPVARLKAGNATAQYAAATAAREIRERDRDVIEKSPADSPPEVYRTAAPSACKNPRVAPRDAGWFLLTKRSV